MLILLNGDKYINLGRKITLSHLFLNYYTLLEYRVNRYNTIRPMLETEPQPNEGSRYYRVAGGGYSHSTLCRLSVYCDLACVWALLTYR